MTPIFNSTFASFAMDHCDFESMILFGTYTVTTELVRCVTVFASSNYRRNGPTDKQSQRERGELIEGRKKCGIWAKVLPLLCPRKKKYIKN